MSQTDVWYIWFLASAWLGLSRHQVSLNISGSEKASPQFVQHSQTLNLEIEWLRGSQHAGIWNKYTLDPILTDDNSYGASLRKLIKKQEISQHAKYPCSFW